MVFNINTHALDDASTPSHRVRQTDRYRSHDTVQTPWISGRLRWHNATVQLSRAVTLRHFRSRIPLHLSTRTQKQYNVSVSRDRSLKLRGESTRGKAGERGVAEQNDTRAPDETDCLCRGKPYCKKPVSLPAIIPWPHSKPNTQKLEAFTTPAKATATKKWE